MKNYIIPIRNINDFTYLENILQVINYNRPNINIENIVLFYSKLLLFYIFDFK